MHALPTGIVTFLAIDIENSTDLRKVYGEAMLVAVRQYDAILTGIVEKYGGAVCTPGGDGCHVAFPMATQAVKAAEEIQVALHQTDWSPLPRLPARITIHPGEANLKPNGGYEYLDPLTHITRFMKITCGERVLLSEATVNLLPRNHSYSISYLGIYRLGSMGYHPVYQLNYPGMPSLPPLPSQNHLPVQTTNFVGRSKEVAEIKALLTPASRLVTITGAGGCGKTRIALQVAADLPEACQENVFLIELVALAKGASDLEIATAIAKKTVTGNSGTSVQASVQDALDQLCTQLAEETSVLVLDNAEHLERGCASVVDSLLRKCPNLSLLVTSRKALNISGEQLYTLPTLSYPTLRQIANGLSVAAYRSHDAILLFEERVKAVKPHFVLNEETAPLIGKICYQVSGLPLAIELIAVRCKSLGLQQVLDYLHDILPRAVSSPGQDNHRTLKAAIQWSYDLLDTEEQKTVFRRLSVFRGDWDIERAQRVGSDETLSEMEVLFAHEELFNSSLIQTVPTVDEDVNARYRLLEPIREFAADLLNECNETETFQNRFVTAYIEMACEIEPRLYGREAVACTQELEREYDNLREALRLASPRERLKLAGTLWRFWMRRGYLNEGIGWLENALRNKAPTPERAKALVGAGVLLYHLQDTKKAREYLRAGMEIYQKRQDCRGIAEVLLNLAHIYRNRKHYKSARDFYTQSLKIYEELRENWWIAALHNNLGLLEYDLRNWEAAQTAYEKALQIFWQCQDSIQIASVNNNLGAVLTMLERYEEALSRYMESLRIYQETQAHFNMTIVLKNIGLIHNRQKRYDEALQSFRQCLWILREQKYTANMPELLRLTGITLIWKGRYAEGVTAIAPAKIVEETQGADLSSKDQQELELALQTARENLGEAAFALHWSKGQQMGLAEAVDWILSLLTD